MSVVFSSRMYVVSKPALAGLADASFDPAADLARTIQAGKDNLATAGVFAGLLLLAVGFLAFKR